MFDAQLMMISGDPAPATMQMAVKKSKLWSSQILHENTYVLLRNGIMTGFLTRLWQELARGYYQF